METIEAKAQLIGGKTVECLDDTKICIKYINDGVVAITEDGEGCIIGQDSLQEDLQSVISEVESMENEKDGEMFKEKVIVAAERIAYSQKEIDCSLYQNILIIEAGYY